MRYPELHYRWSWRLKASPEQLWPSVADTNQFNRDVGLPAVRPAGPDETDATGANARRRLRTSRFGLHIEWDEEPFEWLKPERFGVRRRYRSGPIGSLDVLVSLMPLPETGTLLVYATKVRPRNLLGLLSIPLTMVMYNRRAFEKAFRRYDERAVAAKPSIVTAHRVSFAPGGELRLTEAARQLVESGQESSLVERLVAFVRTADAMTLARVQPYVLADAWGAPRRKVLELFLYATRAGVFDLRWDILCPLCRGAKESTSTLAGVGGQVHCATCNIDVATNLDRSVELTFEICASIRDAVRGTFCVAGPQVTPHVVMQQLLASGESRALRLVLEAGQYRLRTLGQGGGQLVTVAEGGAADVRFRSGADRWPEEEVALGTTSQVTLENAPDAERLLVLERLAWTEGAVTAAQVVGMQAFRDLFSRELLRAGQEISVRSLTIAFTDLRDSTMLYRRIGDGPAFGRVLDHFDVLRDEILAEDGALIKTIGDAVMAVFPQPINAIRAMLKVQARLRAWDRDPPIFLKAGLHEGACITVTLNDRLDYFGSAVNLAARLEKFSSGNDVIVSEAVRRDPEVERFLGESEGLSEETFGAPIKGFDTGEFRLWRIGISEH